MLQPRYSRRDLPAGARLHLYLTAIARGGETGITLAELARALRLPGKKLSGVSSVVGSLYLTGYVQRLGMGRHGRVRLSQAGRDVLATEPPWRGNP